jgi:hypothetical protein
VLLSVQIPVVDARPLLDQDTGRHARPAFPKPERLFARSSVQHHRSSFVAGLGPVRPRLKGGAGPWASENYYVDVSSLVRLRLTELPDERSVAFFRIARLPRPVYRNFHTDGVVGRLEIGFDYDETRVRGHAQMHLPRAWVLDAPTHLRGSGRELPLVEVGAAFARHLLDSTTRGEPESWWVQAGTPAVVTEYPRGEHPPGGYSFAGADEEDGPGSLLSYRWGRHKGVRLLDWQIRHGDSPADEIRRLRIHLSRLHAEFTAFGAVLAQIQAGTLDPRFPPLESYLMRTAKLLNRPSRHGFHQVGLLATALLPMQSAYSDVLESLAYLSSSLPVSPLLQGRLDALQASLGATAGQFPLKDVVFMEIHNETHISGGTVGAVSTGGDAQGAATSGPGAAQVTGASAADIGRLLDVLGAEVAGARARLSEEDAALAEDTVDGVRRELDRPAGERDTSRITARLGRLAALAASLGTAGSAVAGAVTALRAALGL